MLGPNCKKIIPLNRNNDYLEFRSIRYHLIEPEFKNKLHPLKTRILASDEWSIQNWDVCSSLRPIKIKKWRQCHFEHIKMHTFLAGTWTASARCQVLPNGSCQNQIWSKLKALTCIHAVWFDTQVILQSSYYVNKTLCNEFVSAFLTVWSNFQVKRIVLTDTAFFVI